jgi:hypothetical protein
VEAGHQKYLKNQYNFLGKNADETSAVLDEEVRAIGR